MIIVRWLEMTSKNSSLFTWPRKPHKIMHIKSSNLHVHLKNTNETVLTIKDMHIPKNHEVSEVVVVPSLVAKAYQTLATPWTVACQSPLQPRIPEWVAISFSRASSPPRDRTQFPCIAGNLSCCRQILYRLSHQGSHVFEGCHFKEAKWAILLFHWWSW